MKNSLFLFVTIGLSIIFNSCEKVDAPYEKDPQACRGTRKVLVEDFTGHKCGNCPRATKNIYNIKKTLCDERIIVMSIHAGFFASTNLPPYTYDFKCDVGDTIDQDFGVSAVGNPNGMVNRKKVNGSYIISSTQWGSEVAKIIADTSTYPISFDILTILNGASGELATDVRINLDTNLVEPHRLCVYLVEDSIINYQKDYDTTPEDVPDYVHRDVLRGSMNGADGTRISNSAVGGTVFYGFEKTLDPSWNFSEMSVIVFLFNETTKEILQVEQKPLE
jgi:hypothetical protein